MTDFDTLKQIEKELKIELSKVTSLEYNFIGYTLDQADNVIALSLPRCHIKDLQRIISNLKVLTQLRKLNLAHNKLTDMCTRASCIGRVSNSIRSIILSVLNNFLGFNMGNLGCHTYARHENAWHNPARHSRQTFVF